MHSQLSRSRSCKSDLRPTPCRNVTDDTRRDGNENSKVHFNILLYFLSAHARVSSLKYEDAYSSLIGRLPVMT